MSVAEPITGRQKENIPSNICDITSEIVVLSVPRWIKGQVGKYLPIIGARPLQFPMPYSSLGATPMIARGFAKGKTTGKHVMQASKVDRFLGEKSIGGCFIFHKLLQLSA